MGTHYSLNKAPKYLEKRFGAVFDQNFENVYHVSAFDHPSMPVITNEAPGRFSFLHWGLVPFWVKDRAQIKQVRVKTVNARADTLFDRSSFRVPIREKRCLIVMDGYFEWREVGGKTYPYYIHMKDNDAFAVAGIWDEWTDENNMENLRTFSMISVDANAFIRRINNRHKRMPVILPKEDESKWIQPDIGEEGIKSMLKTYEGEELEAYPVKRLIGKKNVNSNTPEVLEEYSYDALKSPGEKNEQQGLKQRTLF